MPGHGYRALALALLLPAWLCLTGAARDPILVAGLSQPEVQVRQGFNGTDLLLFGAILTGEGNRAGHDYDIVVVLEGPSQPVVLREKSRVAGIWVNADSTTFRSAPSFYAVASSRPIAAMVDANTAAIYEMGLKFLQLSPTGSFEPGTQARFAGGLADLMGRHGLYSEDDHGVTITDDVLYQAHITLPSRVQTGTYTAETFAITHGRVVASALNRIEVRKIGFERAVADYSQADGFLYGLLAVAISVGMGWAAGRFFALG